jgi:hypothetical protein
VHPQSHYRFGWFRFAVGAFALCLMLLTALHAPVGVLSAGRQNTATSLGTHARQPCLDSPGFDWTVPQSGFPLFFQSPHRARRSLAFNSIACSSRPSEFRLYNRPPPLS